jgi:hypothetical protein
MQSGSSYESEPNEKQINERWERNRVTPIPVKEKDSSEWRWKTDPRKYHTSPTAIDAYLP